MAVELKQVIVDGTPGFPFNIRGEGFGDAGRLTIGGRTIPTTSWNDKKIKGFLPIDLAPGEVGLTTDTGVLKGIFPYVKAAKV